MMEVKLFMALKQNKPVKKPAKVSVMLNNVIFSEKGSWLWPFYFSFISQVVNKLFPAIMCKDFFFIH